MFAQLGRLHQGLIWLEWKNNCIDPIPQPYNSPSRPTSSENKHDQHFPSAFLRIPFLILQTRRKRIRPPRPKTPERRIKKGNINKQEQELNH